SPCEVSVDTRPVHGAPAAIHRHFMPSKLRRKDQGPREALRANGSSFAALARHLATPALSLPALQSIVRSPTMNPASNVLGSSSPPSSVAGSDTGPTAAEASADPV